MGSFKNNWFVSERHELSKLAFLDVLSQKSCKKIIRLINI